MANKRIDACAKEREDQVRMRSHEVGTGDAAGEMRGLSGFTTQDGDSVPRGVVPRSGAIRDGADRLLLYESQRIAVGVIHIELARPPCLVDGALVNLTGSLRVARRS